MAGNKSSGRKSTIIKPKRLKYRPKPKLKVTATARAQQKFCRNETDEQALAAGYRFNEALAAHAIEFFPKFLKHSEGRWAGKAFELSAFHRDEVIGPLFGWVDADGFRRFAATYFEEPKKNGKSEVAAGVGLYTLTADEEEGAEVASFGADSKQAGVVHSTAINMVEWSPSLSGVLEINKTTGLIRYPAAKAGYSKRSSSPRGQHGPKFHVMILDELHEWYGRLLWDDLKYAQRSRSQPIRFVITNAGKNINSVCYEQRAKALRVLSGERVDHRFLCHVLRVSQEEAQAELDAVGRGEVDDLPIARQCNPMLGTIIKIPALVGDIQDAIETPSELPNLLRLTYGIWASSAEYPLLKAGAWNACRGDFDEEELRGVPCAAGLDLGEVSDPSSFSLVWPELDEDNKRRYTTLTWTWMARKNALADTEENVHLYREWEKDPAARLTLTDGNVTDFAVVRADIIELCNRFACEVLIYDPKQAEKLTQEIVDGIEDAGGTVVIEGVDGLQRIAMAQTLANYGEPTREFEVCVIDERIVHDGNPLLAWEANHVSFVRDKDGNKKPVKPGTDHDARKVDGIQTTVMGVMGAMNYIDLSGAYDDDGAGVVLF